jgi:hypothetical protein
MVARNGEICDIPSIERDRSRWLPCTAEGIPVCFAEQRTEREIIAEYFAKLERQR